MYVTVAVDSIQAKSRFTVAEGELRNSTVGEGGILASNKNSVKIVGGILPGLKILREWYPTQPAKSISYKELLMFMSYKSQNMHFYIFFIIFIDELTYI